MLVTARSPQSSSGSKHKPRFCVVIRKLVCKRISAAQIVKAVGCTDGLFAIITLNQKIKQMSDQTSDSEYGKLIANKPHLDKDDKTS